MPNTHPLAQPPAGAARGTRQPNTGRTLRLIHAAAGLGLLLVLVLAVSVVWQSHTKTVQDAQLDVARVAVATESNLNRTLMGLDAMLAEIASWPPTLDLVTDKKTRTLELTRLLSATLNSNLLLRNIAVINPAGDVLATAQPGSGRLGLGADPRFLRAVQTQPFPALMISTPVQTDLMPEPVLHLARSTNRSFGPPVVVVAELRLAPLVSQLDPGDPTNSISLTLEKADGQLLAAYPTNDRGDLFTLQPPLPELVLGLNANAELHGNTLATQARLGGQASWLSIRHLVYPGLWVSASKSQAEVLLDWRTESLTVAAIAAVLWAFMGGLWWNGVRHVRHMAQANARIGAVNEQLGVGNQALMQSLSLLEATLDATADAVVVLDQHQRVVRVNKRFVQGSGLQANQLMGRDADWLHQRLFQRIDNNSAIQAVKQREQHDPDSEALDEIRFHDGQIFLRHSTPQRLNGEIVGRVLSYQNITALRQTVQKLQEREAVLEQTRADLSATLEAIPDLLFELDEHGTYLAVHAQNAQQLIVSPDLFLGKRFTDLLSTRSASVGMACLREAIDTGSSYGQQLRLMVGKEPIWFELSASRKPTPPGAVRRAVVLARDITDRKRSEETIWQQAHMDQLTGLPNRRLFREHLDKTLLAANGHNPPSPVGLLFVDLDRFKLINDTHGHEKGDLLLQLAAQRLRDCTQPSDLVARLGGDEFTLVVQGDGVPERMPCIAQLVVDSLSNAFVLGSDTEYISASVGMTLFPVDAQDSDTLVRQADQAMYAAKQAGRNRCERFSPLLQETTLARARTARDLRFALSANQMSVAYQPIVCLRTGQTHKAEALLRWQHPLHGPISPADFIPVAEEFGLINELGEWVFVQAAHQVKQWRADLHPDFQISVNKSPVQFRGKAASCSQWGLYLSGLGLPGNSIAVEITEGLLMEASDDARTHLQQLSSAGLHLALDDFGTGYSALSYLHQYDLNVLKIDRSFVRHLTLGSKDLALCKASIVMAHELGMAVVAEGIETPEQARLLADAGCDYGQGYWYSPPIPAAELAEWVKKSNSLSS